MKRVIFTISGLFFLFLNTIYSQEIQPNDEMVIYSEESDMPRRIGYNPLNYFEQERYRPDHSLFSNNHFTDNMSIGLYGGIDGIFQREGSFFLAGPRLGIYVSKFFSPVSGLELSASMARNKNKFSDYNLRSYNISADYDFNLTSFISDYNPYKRFQVISSQGVGVNFSKYINDNETSFDLHWGLKFKFVTRSQVNFFVEPRLSLYTDQIDFSEKRNWRRYDIGYGTLLGIDYSFGNSLIGSGETVKYTGWNGLFVGFAGGVQASLNGITDEISLKRALGPSLSITVGKWFSSFAGMKASMFGSANSWTTDNYSESFPYLSQAAYWGGRFEAMFNLFGFSERSRISPFSIEPSGGIEYGLAFKQANDPRKKSYLGATAAVQFKYRLYPDLAFYIEPRYSFVPFRNTNSRFETVTKDKLVSVNFGIEAVNLGRGTGKSAILPREIDEFTPHFTFSSGIGGAVVVQQRHFINRAISHMANIGVGYWFNSVSGLRLDGNMGTAISRMPNDLAQVNVSSSLNYTLNIVNLLAGYDNERRWDAEVFLGPLFGYVAKTGHPLKLNYGMQAGGRLSYKVSGNFDFYAEPRMHAYAKRLFPDNTGAIAIANLNFGATYHFAYRGMRPAGIKSSNGFLDNTFFGVSMGAVNTWENFRSNHPSKKVLNATGAEYSVYLGKWLTPYIGLKASLLGNFYSHGISTIENKPDKVTAYAGAGLEMMFNPFRIGEHGRTFKVELVPMAGIRANQIFRQTGKKDLLEGQVTSFTMAMQIRYNVADNMAVVLEPRWTRAPYNEGLTRVREDMLALNLGVELVHRHDKNHKSISVQRKGYKRYGFVSLNGGLNSQLVAERYNGMKLGYGFELYAGYSLTPSSAFRIGYDICMLPPRSSVVEKPEFHGHNISVNYLLDMSNFVAGYNPERKVGFSLFAGPVFSNQGKGDLRVFRIGGEFGALGYVNLTDKLVLNLQPKGRVFLPSSKKAETNFRQLIFDFTAGFTYKF